MVNVGMVGYAFMGAAHSHAWRTAGRVFDLPPIAMTAICGRNEDGVRAAAARYGWASHETDWRALVARSDIDIVDICTPGDSHAEIAIAALRAGKHVLCEKPLANSVAEAEAMAAAAAEADGRSMVAFNYRRVPALALAHKLIAAGRLGEIRHVRAQYLQDWLVDKDFPLVWRLRAERAGSGALGDLGAHAIDLAQYLTGRRITSVGALLTTFVTERPLPAESSGLSASGGAGRGQVTVDDAALCTARFDGGAVGVFEATRFAAGRKNAFRIEVNGSSGSIAFDMESMNELSFMDGTEDADTAGFRRILVTEPTHPYLDAWWPPGHILGYEHTFVHEVRDFVAAIADGIDPAPSFADGLQVQRVLAAVRTSADAAGVHVAP
ncbi:MAG TPA: Gfo/Idh/MocA family oxidoreductase [Pseudonocardiaceae bacterium]